MNIQLGALLGKQGQGGITGLSLLKPLKWGSPMDPPHSRASAACGGGNIPCSISQSLQPGIGMLGRAGIELFPGEFTLLLVHVLHVSSSHWIKYN